MPVRIALPIVLLLAGAACGATIDSTFDDARITAAVKTALLNDTSVDGTAVQVRTASGVVYLSGCVGSAVELGRVEAVVRGVAGVRRVESVLMVGGDSPVP